jgi:hypothetical protein
MPGQLHPTGVTHAAEDRPVVDGQTQQCGRQCGDQAAVRDKHHRPIRLV